MGRLHFNKPLALSREELQQTARSLGADLVGFVGTDRLESLAPAELRPSTIDPESKSVIVFGKRTLAGVVWSRHLPSKQLAGGHNLRRLDHIGHELTDLLEERGHPSVPISSGALDFEKRGPDNITPAGQGSYLLRLAGVESGLGTWGLNMMVLTPQYGPRVYWGGVLTRLPVEGGVPIESELCLGLEECGRCAAICPEDAIPRRARASAPLTEIRGLDCNACARSSQPFGFQTFVDHTAEILKTQDATEMWGRMRNRKSGEIWAEMAMMKEASLTGCSDCTQVCPVGDDYARVQNSPHRKEDLPESIPRSYQDGFVEVAHLGPKVRRNTTWDTEKKKT